MLPNSFCGTNSVKKFSITFTNFPHSISPRSLIGIIKNYANLVKTWIWTQSIWRQGKTSEMHKLEGKSHKGEKEGREVLTWSPFDTWHTLHHWNGIVVIWFVARGVLRWRGPLLEAKVKARGNLHLQSHTNPTKRTTVNPKSFSTQAPILQTLLDTVLTSKTSQFSCHSNSAKVTTMW